MLFFQAFSVFVLLALPWLNPFAPGPSPAVVPLLFAWICAAGLLGLRVLRGDALVSQRLVAPALAAWLSVGLVSSAIGLLQYFGGTSGLDPWINQTAQGEAFANLRQRNQFATLTNIALAALIWWVYRLTLSGDYPANGSGEYAVSGVNPVFARRAMPFLCGFAAVLIAVGNAASSSRTGLVELMVLIALVLWWGGWQYRAVRWVLLVALAAYGAAVLALPWLAGLDIGSQSLLARLRDGAPACSSRWLLWSNVLDLIALKPWLGWGWGELDYAHYAHLYNGPRFCEILDNAHNLPLHLAVELGVPVAVLVCGGVLWWVLRQQPWREPDPTRQLAWAVLAVIGVHSLLEYPLWYGPFQMAVVLCVLLLRRSNATPPLDLKKQSDWPVAQVFPAVVATVVIAAIGHAAWDYRRVSQIYLDASARDRSLREDTLAKISNTRWFRNQFLFAELGLTALTPASAQWTFDTASTLLHYSPEPRVIEKAIESATLLGLDAEAVAHLARYRAAFPVDYARWSRARGQGGVISGNTP